MSKCGEDISDTLTCTSCVTFVFLQSHGNSSKAYMVLAVRHSACALNEQRTKYEGPYIDFG